jgi:hypothetical protein
MHMLVCIIIFITSCNTTFRPVPTFAYQCMSVSYVVCSPDACLLGWHLEPIVMNMVSVQVCSESTGHAEVFKPPLTLSRLSMVSWRTCCFPAISPPVELAMMSTHSTHPAEKYHTEGQKQVGAAVPFLACRAWM